MFSWYIKNHYIVNLEKLKNYIGNGNPEFEQTTEFYLKKKKEKLIFFF